MCSDRIHSRRMTFSAIRWLLVLAGLQLGAQISPQLGKEALPPPKSIFEGQGTDPAALYRSFLAQGVDALPPSAERTVPDPNRVQDQEQRSEEIKRLKALDAGVPKFAEDLFEVRQASAVVSDGGISEDYVLGPGDRLNLHVFGSASFDTAVQVDGRGMVAIPRVGSIKIGGLSLGKAKAAVQGLLGRNFSRATSDLQVTKLREIRVSILGEVYQPGSYLISSVSSLINILGLAGGPTRQGSLRSIRVLRGGEIVHQLDLYPLRAEGRGNLNLFLQSGDVLFVPLARLEVILEGAFLRVGGKALLLSGGEGGPGSPSERQAKAQLGRDFQGASGTDALSWFNSETTAPPRMSFELLPGESVKSLMEFSGGLLPEWSSGLLTLRRRTPSGLVEVKTFQSGHPSLDTLQLQRGDVLSAFPRREGTEAQVELSGWVRVPGIFARTEGMRVSALLQQGQQVLPDTYLLRGEIIRRHLDERTEYLSFSVERALAGDANHDRLLQDRDQVRLHHVSRMRLKEKVRVLGPVHKPGEYLLHYGMRVSDLLFQAGLPQKQANLLIGELARSDGKGGSHVRRLDLKALLSSEAQSPVELIDESLNPVLLPDDFVSLYEKPDFRLHRLVKVTGQVQRPGNYVFEDGKATLRQLLQRAGGLMPEAMPKAGILLRQVGNTSVSGKVGVAQSDPTGRGINEILERLSEVKRQPTTGQLLKTPVLHGLAEGKLNRLVVDFEKAMNGALEFDVELKDGDEIFIPTRTDAAYVIGETASPFGTYRVNPGMNFKDLLNLAGGLTRNADSWNLRVLRADGRVLDRGVKSLKVEPGDALIVPQKIRRDTTWQENLNSLTPVALILNAILR